MDYDRIANVVGEIKFRYVETGKWDSKLCEELLMLTQQIPLMVCRKRGICKDDQEDLVQFSYQEVFRSLHRIEDDRAFPRYLFVTVENLCQKYWRDRYRSAVITPVSDETFLLTTLKMSREMTQDELLREDLREAITHLPEIYRKVIELYYFAGLSAKEISERNGESINTITSRLRRGRNMLREDMEK